MPLRNLISEDMFLPISDMFTGNSVSKNLRLLRTSQYWPREKIDEYQNQKLRALIHHAYENVPFYRELYTNSRIKPSDIQTKEDLQKLPIITKDDLRINRGKHFAGNIKKKSLVFASSSGSTGEPFQYYTTKEAESILKAAAIRAWYWMGYRLGDKYVKVSMNPRNSILKKIQDRVNNSLYISSNQLTKDNFYLIADKIHNFDPLFIRSYPVPCHFLAERIKETKGIYQNDSLKAINTTGSTLSNEIRKEINEVFRVKIFDSYSCEGGTVFSECPTQDHYHPAEEYAISEFIEDNYSIMDPDKPMRHITTDLFNYASPFIRYDTQDYVVLGSEELCSCGRHFKNVKSIKGRDSDIIITPSGKFLIVENFVAYFEWISEVDQIQVIQEEKDEIVIKMVVNEKFNNNILQKIQVFWDKYIGDDVIVKIEVVNEINLTPTGKRRTVVRNPKIPINA